MRARALPSIVVFLVLVVAGGCSQAGVASGAEPRTNPDRIATDELSSGRYTNAYEAVRSLRPGWLRTRAATSFSQTEAEIVVYVDNVRYGDPESLRSLPSGDLEYLQWIDGTMATQRWGTGHVNGAILAVTRNP